MTITSLLSPTIQALFLKSGCPGASVISFSMFMSPVCPAPESQGTCGGPQPPVSLSWLRT